MRHYVISLNKRERYIHHNHFRYDVHNHFSFILQEHEPVSCSSLIPRILLLIPFIFKLEKDKRRQIILDKNLVIISPAYCTNLLETPSRPFFSPFFRRVYLSYLFLYLSSRYFFVSPSLCRISRDI